MKRFKLSEIALITIGVVFFMSGVAFGQDARVTGNGWADFVFDDSYKLPSLEDVESFIK